MSRDPRWTSLDATQFEEFCADLLADMGFANVVRLGGTGDRGRDITCQRTFDYGSGIADVFRWVIQCKNVAELKYFELADDLAKASAHRPDVWWLITATDVPPAFADWLVEQDRQRRFSFKISYVDGSTLFRILNGYPRLLLKYWPEEEKAVELAESIAMDLMNANDYSAAIQHLELHESCGNPRLLYLLACSHSAISRNSGDRDSHIIAAFDYLQSAFDQQYLAYARARYGWPITNTRPRVWRDEELQPLRRRDSDRMKRIIGIDDADTLIGCLPADVAVLTSNGEISIGALSVGTMLTTIVADITAKLVELHRGEARLLLSINDQLRTTLSQPIATARGWIRAGELQIGDILVSVSGPVLVRSLHQTIGRSAVYNLSLDQVHNYFANGYLVHNKLYS